MIRIFDPSLIEIRLNPFSSTRSSSISEGVFMKDLLNSIEYFINPDTEIDIKILHELKLKLSDIESGKSPQHILVLGEYGQGKSFSLKKIQDDIYKNYNGAIISIPIGMNFISVDQFEEKLIEDIEELFENLDTTLYTDKENIRSKFSLTTKPKTFRQSIDAYDKAYKELNILVYIFIDELDKIVISEMPESDIRVFLEKLKLIGDTCSKSISLLIAGTPNCLIKMDLLSVDYSQRFDKIECNFLSSEETVDYITKKCFIKLKYVGNHPFNLQVKKQIHFLAEGNLRKIETICRELWNYSFRKRTKITTTELHNFLYEKLIEHIKNTLGINATNNLVLFVLLLFINKGQKNVRYFKVKLKPNQFKEIDNFVSNHLYIKKINQTYFLDKSIIDSLANKLFN